MSDYIPGNSAPLQTRFISASSDFVLGQCTVLYYGIFERQNILRSLSYSEILFELFFPNMSDGIYSDTFPGDPTLFFIYVKLQQTVPYVLLNIRQYLSNISIHLYRQKTKRLKMFTF